MFASPTCSWATNAWQRCSYGDTATIWRINLGWRKRRNLNERGFWLDLERGYWASNQDDDETDQEDPSSAGSNVWSPTLKTTGT